MTIVATLHFALRGYTFKSVALPTRFYWSDTVQDIYETVTRDSLAFPSDPDECDEIKIELKIVPP